jgi:peptide/nickel transport system permease protein
MRAWVLAARRAGVSAMVGFGIVLAVAVLAILAPILAPVGPLELDVRSRLAAPSSGHPFGTDNLGRDILSRVLYGSRLSLIIGLSVVVSSGVLGLLMGLLAGASARLDQLLMRVSDGLMAFPGILLAIALMAALGQRLSNIVIALTVLYTPRVARVVRGVVLSIRELEYVQAARAVGASEARVFGVHILPNSLAPLVVQTTFVFAESVLLEAALNFLGAGLPPDVPTWGTIIAAGRVYLQSAPWITAFPGVAIMVFVLGLNLLGDGLRDLVDPRTRVMVR